MEDILYLCDRRACPKCHNGQSECQHTTNIKHSKNQWTKESAEHALSVYFDKCAWDDKRFYVEREIPGMIGRPLFANMVVDKVECADGGYYKVTLKSIAGEDAVMTLRMKENVPKKGSRVFLNFSWTRAYSKKG